MILVASVGLLSGLGWQQETIRARGFSFALVAGVFMLVPASSELAQVHIHGRLVRNPRLMRLGIMAVAMMAVILVVPTLRELMGFAVPTVDWTLGLGVILAGEAVILAALHWHRYTRRAGSSCIAARALPLANGVLSRSQRSPLTLRTEEAAPQSMQPSSETQVHRFHERPLALRWVPQQAPEDRQAESSCQVDCRRCGGPRCAVVFLGLAVGGNVMLLASQSPACPAFKLYRALRLGIIRDRADEKPKQPLRLALMVRSAHADVRRAHSLRQ